MNIAKVSKCIKFWEILKTYTDLLSYIADEMVKL